MLKEVEKWCVKEYCGDECTIIDAYSTREQAEFKCTQMQEKYLQFALARIKPANSRWIASLNYHYEVDKDKVLIFIE